MVQLNYAGKIKQEGKMYKIVANWDSSITAKGASLSQAKNKFSEVVAKNGVDPEKVGFEFTF